MSGEKQVATFFARVHIDVDGKHARLAQGVNVTAEIKISNIRVIDYLPGSIQRAGHQSSREC